MNLDMLGAAPVMRTLSLGSSGPDVEAVQRALASVGFLLPGDVDGVFGPRTRAAVRALQRAQGLAPDGVVGPDTVSALDVSGQSAPNARRGPVSDGGTVPASSAVIPDRAGWRTSVASAAVGLGLGVVFGVLLRGLGHRADRWRIATGDTLPAISVFRGAVR